VVLIGSDLKFKIMNIKFIKYLRISFLITASTVGFIVFYCTLKCNKELIILEGIQGRQDEIRQWYFNEPAREIYHGVLRNESEVLYWWPHLYIFSIVLWVMCVILGGRGRKVFDAINFSGAAMIIFMLCVCLYYWRTWRIVTMVID
jgi:hypothetical protein